MCGCGPCPPGDGDASVEAMAADVEEGAESKWVSLPWELLCPVLSRLALSDLIRSAVVCKRWRLAADEAYDDDDHPSCSLPWLWGINSRDFYSLPDRRSYSLDPPPPYVAGVVAIHEDWSVVSARSGAVAMGDDAVPIDLYFLYNPFSRQRIDLPPIHARSPCTPSPLFAFSRNPGDPECVAAFHLSQGVGFCNLAAAATAAVGDHGLGEAGKEAGWKMIPPCRDERTYVGLAFYNGFICLATRYGALDVADAVSLEIKTAFPSPPQQNLPRRLSLRVRHDYLGFRKYTLRAAGGEVLMLCFVPSRFSCGTPIAIYRANFEGGRWEILQTLGGRAILLGPGSFFSVRPSHQKLSYGLKENCVYLLGGKHSVRKLRLTEESCRTFNLVEDDRGSDFRPSSFRNRKFFMLAPPKPKFYV